MTFEQLNCNMCGQPKNAMRDGGEIQLRCHCDWERGFFDRVKATIHPDFRTRKLIHWGPKLFAGGDSPEVMKAQAIAAMLRLYEFCHKPCGDKTYSLNKSVAAGKNLFIRGPRGSGKGLLTSSVKMLAAAQGVSVTPLPGDYDVFRTWLSQSEAFNADEAKATVANNYVHPDVMVVENVRAETQLRITGEKTGRKFRASGAADDVFARRRMKPGSVVLSSSDFAGEIADTLGDGMLETLLSDKTSMILLFSPAEASALMAGLTRRHDALSADVAKLRASDAKKSLKDTLEEKKDALAVRNALYFAEVFKWVPNGGRSGGEYDTTQMTKTINMCANLPPFAVRELAAFNEARLKKDAAYQENLKKAQADAIKECSEIATKMTDKEMVEAGKVLSLATNKTRLEELGKLAHEKREEMSGVKR